MNCHLAYRFLFIFCVTALSIPLRAAPDDLPSPPPALQRHAGSLKVILEVSGPGGKAIVFHTATIPNGDGELMPDTVKAYRAMEDKHYRIGKVVSPYERAEEPVAGPSKVMDCGGSTLYRLCRGEGAEVPIIDCQGELPMINFPAADFAKILARFAEPVSSGDDIKRGDVVYWCRTPLGANKAHVSYVEMAEGTKVSVLVTKDQAESMLHRNGPLGYDKEDLLYRRYGSAQVYRLKQGVKLKWRYWAPWDTTNPKPEKVAGEWVAEEKPEQRYVFKIMDRFRGERPLAITDKVTSRTAYAAYASPTVLYRTEWGQGAGQWMTYQARVEGDRITWTNAIERRLDPSAPNGWSTRPFTPVAWTRNVEGQVTYTGTWMHKYELEGGRHSVRPLTGGQEFANGKMRPLTVTGNSARMVVDLSTGKVTGRLEVGYKYEKTSEDDHFGGGMPLTRTELEDTWVDPVAFRTQRGLFYLKTKKGTRLVFSRDVKFQPPGWPNLGESFALLGVSDSQLDKLSKGDYSDLPNDFCVLSTKGIRLPYGARHGSDPTGQIAEQVKAQIEQGQPVVLCHDILSPSAGGVDATVVDGATGVKGPLSVGAVLPRGSIVETNGDQVILSVTLSDKGVTEIASTRVGLKPGSRFDTGKFLNTAEALEVLLFVGAAEIEGNSEKTKAALQKVTAVRTAMKLAMKIVTPTATVFKDNTHFHLNVDPTTGATTVKVVEGQVTVRPTNASLPPITLNSRQQATVTKTETNGPQAYQPTAEEAAPVAGSGLTEEVLVAALGSSAGATASSSGPGATATVSNGPKFPPEEGTPAVVNTFVHHQLTVDDAIADGVFPVISGSGNRIVFSHGGRPSHIYCVDFDGSNRTRVMEIRDFPSELDISDDGSRVMVHHIGREVYTAGASGGGERKLVWTHDPEFVKARLTGDGRLVYFLLGRPASLNGATERSPAGLYVVSAEGGAPQLLVGQQHLQKALGLPSDEGVAFHASLDVSANGGRIAFGVVAYSKVNPGPKILVVDGDGGNLRLVAEGTKDSRGGLGQVSITPDGNLVSYRLASWGPPQVLGVVRADGSGNTELLKPTPQIRYPDGNLNGEPITFTADGKWLHLGSTGLLIATDGSGRVYSLTATRAGAGKVLLSGGMLRGTMDHQARRYAYLCGDERNSREFRQRNQVATLEVNPPEMRDAPRISDVTIEPNYLIPDKVGAKVTANVASPHKLVLVSKVPLFKGRADPGVSSEIFYDDGRTSGDKTAGDGVFTTNRLFATQSAVMGPRTIRIDAESRGDDARRHATVVEVAPILVTTTKPEPPKPPEPEPPPPFVEPAGPSTGSLAEGMRIEAEHRRVAVGEQVTVPVWLKDAQNIANVNFEITYDPMVAVPAGDVIKGNMLSSAIFSANARESGRMRIGFAQTSGLGGTGTVAQLPMKAVGKPGSRTPLTVTVTSIDDPGGTTLAIQKIHGSTLIVGADGHVPGDCDGDGTITAADAMCALKMSVGNMAINMRLDADKNGQVTSGDARVLLKRAVGIK